MSAQFDPYQQWLQISPTGRAPTHYELLGLPTFSGDPHQAREAAMARIAHVRKYQTGKHSEAAIRLMNEISQALTCLVDPIARQAYDRLLRGADTVEDVAVAALTENRLPPPPRQMSGGASLEDLSAIVDATEPPSGAAPYIHVRVPANLGRRTRRDPANLTTGLAAGVAVILLLLSLYGISRLPASKVDSPSAAAGNGSTTPAPRPKEPIAPTLTQPAPAAPAPPVHNDPLPSKPDRALQLGEQGTWEGTLAEIYIDPSTQHAHLLVNLVDPFREAVEAINNDLNAILALVAFVSDAESGGRGDRVRISGTVVEGDRALFVSRTQPLIRFDSLGPASSSTPTYQLGGEPPRIGPLKFNSPLTYLLRLRPAHNRVYQFEAVFKSAEADPQRSGLTFRVVPGGPDTREVSVSIPASERKKLAQFQPGDPVTLQAEVSSADSPPEAQPACLAHVQDGQPSRACGSTEKTIHRRGRTDGPAEHRHIPALIPLSACGLAATRKWLAVTPLDPVAAASRFSFHRGSEGKMK